MINLFIFFNDLGQSETGLSKLQIAQKILVNRSKYFHNRVNRFVETHFEFYLLYVISILTFH